MAGISSSPSSSRHHEKTKKPAPSIKASQCTPLAFTYEPSPNGIDSNLVILLHGLGDSEKPFANLGKRLQKNLPQTAILSLRGSHAVPFMEQDAWGYWDVWDAMGQDVQSPNPSVFLQAFQQLITYLIRPIEHASAGCGWRPSSIHIFGFAHGATAALEGIIAYTLNGPRRQPQDQQQQQLGSVVSVCGDFLSHPTFSPPLDVPLLMFERKEPTTNARSTIARAFSNVEFALFPSSSPSSQPSPAMPTTETEWGAIMQFWAKRIRNRSKWELEGQVTEMS